MFLLAKAGADVAYILTGQRLGTTKEAEGPPTGGDKRLAALVDNYMECGEEDRRALERMALLAAKAEPEEAVKPKAPRRKKAG